MNKYNFIFSDVSYTFRAKSDEVAENISYLLGVDIYTETSELISSQGKLPEDTTNIKRAIATTIPSQYITTNIWERSKSFTDPLYRLQFLQRENAKQNPLQVITPYNKLKVILNYLK